MESEEWVGPVITLLIPILITDAQIIIITETKIILTVLIRGKERGKSGWGR